MSARFDSTRIDGAAAIADAVLTRISAAKTAHSSTALTTLLIEPPVERPLPERLSVPDPQRPRAGSKPLLCREYCCHTSGTRGTATCTKIVAAGGAGLFFGCMFACFGSRSPLRRLHGAQHVTMLSHDDAPPFERGITWSTVRLVWPVPQYWQVHWSRAKIARRVILRLWASRGTRT